MSDASSERSERPADLAQEDPLRTVQGTCAIPHHILGDFKENLHMFDALDFLAQLTQDAWASNTTTQEWYDLPSISRRRDYN